MTPEQAITYIDEQVAWLRSQGRIPDFVQKKLVESLECLIEATGQKKEDANTEAETNHCYQVIRKLRTLLRITGLTEKTIEEALAFPEVFLENWLVKCSRTGLYLKSETGWLLMEGAFRSNKLIAESDIETIAGYRFLVENKLGHAAAQIRQMYPHLEAWFNEAGSGVYINLKQAAIKLFEYHCEQN